MARATAALLVAFAAVFLGCDKPDGPGGAPASAIAAPAASTSAVVAATTAPAPPPGPPGDAVHGKELVGTFECNRCHDGTGLAAPKDEKQCFHCHERILAGTFKAPSAAILERWERAVVPYRYAPSLEGSQKRLRAAWIQRFLQDPYDLRPHLAATMPRLPISAEQARDIAAYLGSAAASADPAPTGDATRGRQLLEDKGCPACHAFSGVPKLAGTPAEIDAKTMTAAVALAPDFKHTRDRMDAATVARWVKSPKAMKPDTPMPEVALTDAEAADIAAYVTTASLAPAVPPSRAARLPLLTRKVNFEEVSTRIFRRTCWHCHGEPDYSLGDGGPGNTGGFGFKPRGLALTDYGNVASGYVDDAGDRHSAFEKGSDKTPRMLAALLARADEEAGNPNAELRGMPLGYPSLPPEDIQLLASWIDQGRPR